MTELDARIATTTADLHAGSDIAIAAFDLAEPAWIARAKRLASARRAPAEPWLLEADGRAVASLLAYPLTMVTSTGELTPAFGYGAVATLPTERRRGYASHLCRVVAEHLRERGRGSGLLFSGIPPRTYERLGWRCIPAFDQTSTRLAELARTGDANAWHALDPRHSRAQLSALYESTHRGTLHHRRDEAGWRRTLEVAPDDLWLGLGAIDGELRGYARVNIDEADFDLAEFALLDATEEEAALGGLAALAQGEGLARMRAWLEPSPAVERWFERGERVKTQPMVLGLEPPERALLWWSDYF